MKSILSAVVGATLALSAIETDAQATPGERQVALAVQSESLAEALDQWARQSGYQIFLQNWDLAKQIKAPNLKGTYGAQEALEKLLANTPLTFRWLSGRAVAIHERTSRALPAAWQTGSRDSAGISKFANDDPDAPASAVEGASSGNPSSPSVAANESLDGRSSLIDRFEEVVVAGSRLRRGGPEGPAPVVILDRKRIDQLGVTNVADVLSYVPQQSFSMGEVVTFGGARTVSLRGLSVGTTLILINGRRTVTSALQGALGGFDINTIPLAAVDRIEVLSGSASSVYGADAVGGVVNVVLKSKIDQPALDLYFGAADGGGEEGRGSATFGWNQNTFRGSAVLDYQRREPLLGSERAFSSNEDFTRFGSFDIRASQSNPANVCSVDGSNLPGLSAACASVPRGSSGVGLTPASFLPTSGQTNLTSLSRYTSLIPEDERYSLAVFTEWDFAPHATAFAEGYYTRDEQFREAAPSVLRSGIIPGENPFNPFGVPVSVDYLFTGVGPITDRFESDAYRAVLGARGDLGKWNWEVSVLRLHDDASYVTLNRTDSAAVAATQTSTDPSTAFNFFEDGPGGSSALIDSLRSAPIQNDFTTKAVQGNAQIIGELLSLPAGPLEIVVGAESRKEELFYDNAGILLSQERRSDSGYAEFRVPLASHALRRSLVEELSLLVSARYDRYEDFGDTFNPQVGLTWRPFRQLLIRGAYGTSFRAPSMFEAYEPLRIITSRVTDPLRNNQRISVPRSNGGNPNIEPEEAESISAGIVFTPEALEGVRVELSYWSIRQEKRVLSPLPSFLLANSAVFDSRILRAAPSPADIAAGLPGPLTFLDTTTVNAGVLDTSGVDFEIRHAFESRIGTFSPRLSATWVHEYDSADLPGAEATDRLGVADAFGLGTIPKWRLTAAVDWQKGGLGFATVGRYVSKYDDTLFGLPNGEEVSQPVIVDVQLFLDFHAMDSQVPAWSQGIMLRAGVRNVFDKEPAFTFATGFLGYDPSQSDLRQRFAYINLSKKF